MAEAQSTDGSSGAVPFAEGFERFERALPLEHWRSYALHGLLLLLTFLSTTAFGAALADAFHSGQALGANGFYEGYLQLARLQRGFWAGLSFSIPLLTILLAHELGHYVACRRWRVDASLPYFLPSPTLLGTFGAFIRIRSPIYTRKILFDVGVSGPLAGFVVLLPVLALGVAFSRLAPGTLHGDFLFSTPLLLRVAEWIRFGSVAPRSILLHPMAMAAWAGLLATAINLLPMGQLDGGHILYSILGERGHRAVSTIVVGVLLLLGFLYWPWWGWAVLMFFFGRRHPLVYDSTPLRGRRLWFGVAALLVLALSLSVIPVAQP